MALTAAQLSDVSSVAEDYIEKGIPDTLGLANFGLHHLMQNKKYISGGDTVRYPILLKETESADFINGTTDVTSTNPQQNFTHGNLNWKFYYCNVVVTLDDLTRAGDTEQAIVNLFTEKVNFAKNKITRDLSRAYHESGTAANKQFNGLPDIFATSGTAYAGITDTDFDDRTQWLPEIDSGTQIVNYRNISKMIDKLRQRCQGLYNQNTGQGYDVDIMFSNYAVRNAFTATEHDKARYYDKETLKAGFEVININGVKWAIDGNTPGTMDGLTADNYLYILSSKSMEFFYKYGIDKKCPLDQKSQILPNQPITFNSNYWAGNVGCNNRRVNGVFKTLVA